MTDDERRLRRYKHVKQHFGLTPEQYDKLVNDQNNCCAICHESESEINKKSTHIKPLSVDHDHATGKVRGLLCSRCNQGLGKFKDDPQLLINAIKYLKKTSV